MKANSFKLIMLLSLIITFLSGCTSESKNTSEAQISTFQERVSILEAQVLDLQNRNRELLADNENKFITINQLNEKINELKSINDSKVYYDLYNEPVIFDGEDDMSYYSKDRKLDKNYSIIEPLEKLVTINSYLNSFRKLTNKSRKYFSEKDLELIGNTDSALQLIGFNNIPIHIKGALYDQNYIINKLAYGIAIEKYKDGEISKDEIVNCSNEYKKQKLIYEDFIKNTRFAD